MGQIKCSSAVTSWCIILRILDVACASGLMAKPGLRIVVTIAEHACDHVLKRV